MGPAKDELPGCGRRRLSVSVGGRTDLRPVSSSPFFLPIFPPTTHEGQADATSCEARDIRVERKIKMGRRKPRPMKCGDLEPPEGTADATELGGDRQNASAMCCMTNFCPDGNYLLCNAAMQMLHCVCEWPQLPSTVPLTTCPQTGLEYFWVRMRVCAKIERYRGFVAMFWRERSLSHRCYMAGSQGLTSFTPIPAKSLMLRVTSVMRRVSAVAAI